MGRVLVIEDEPRIANLVRRVLAPHVETVDVANDGEEGIDMATADRYDLVVLDLLLPGRDGVYVLEELMRVEPSTRVLVLSALSDVEERVRCLRLGAADYMVKPFSIDELVARVDARLRESGVTGHGGSSVKGLKLDPRRRTAHVSHGEVRLTEKEFLVLDHLARCAPRAADRDLMLRLVWGVDLDADAASNLVDVCVRRLRQKLGHDLIETVRNVGYRLATAP